MTAGTTAPAPAGATDAAAEVAVTVVDCDTHPLVLATELADYVPEPHRTRHFVNLLHEFDANALDHYEAIVDRSLSLGMAPVVTFNHMTSPHWFAARGGWALVMRRDLYKG